MRPPATSSAAPAHPVDRPPVPRPRFSTTAAVFAVLGTLILGGYTAIAFTGYEPGSPQRDEIPASVRASPGGYRSYHFWYSGYHGGK